MIRSLGKQADRGLTNCRENVPRVFIIIELRRGVQNGLPLFVPFILIDLIVATVLMSMGIYDGRRYDFPAVEDTLFFGPCGRMAVDCEFP